MKRRQFVQAGSALIACGLAPWTTRESAAQTFPTQPMTIIVAFAPGGPADTMSRAVAQEMSAQIGQPVIVDNRAGAGGKIAMQALLRAPRDGHTLAYLSGSIMSIAPLVDKDLGYDTTRDIVALTTGLRGSNVLAVHPSLPIRSVRDLVEYAKVNPGKLNYGSIGNGSWYHLTTEKILSGLGIEATHVPYKGEAPGMTDLVAGTIQMMLLSGAAKSILDEGRVIGLAATGARPAKHFPSAPPIRDVGIAALSDFDETPWIGFGMAAGARPEIVTRAHGALVNALNAESVRKRLAAFGDIQTSTPAELQTIIQRELATNRQLLTSGRVKLG